jgi:hypothetical protein
MFGPRKTSSDVVSEANIGFDFCEASAIPALRLDPNEKLSPYRRPCGYHRYQPPSQLRWFLKSQRYPLHAMADFDLECGCS